MDLGISGRKAIICASSRGLGKACARSLAREGTLVVINGRDGGQLEQTAGEIRAEGAVAVTTVCCDVTTPEGQRALLAACPEPDILVTNAGGPPPGDFRRLSREDWVRGLVANMLTPIELMKAVIDGMIERRFGRIVHITSISTKMPIPTLGLSNGARTGLAGFVAGVARETVRHNVTINCLLPGPFDTDRLRAGIEAEVRSTGKSYDEIRRARVEANPAGRFGRPEELGDACAFLCSAQMGFVTGQHFLMDGGAYPGTF